MADDKYLRKVQALLDRASHPNTPPAEREASLSKARALMEEHRIEEAMLNANRSDEDRSKDVETREYRLEDHFEYMGNQTSIMGAVFGTTGCMVRPFWNGVKAVGFAHDLNMAEMLWFNIQADFISKLFPAWDERLDKEANIYNIKSAGYSWMDLVKMAPESAGLNANSGSYLRAAFKREAAKRGLENVQHSRTPAKYRASFSESYASRVRQRLVEMKNEARTEATAGDDSKAVAIIRDEDLLKEEFYRLFPDLRPLAEEEAHRLMEEHERKERERRAKMTQAERDAEDRRNERENERWRRRMVREEARRQPDALGWRNGYDAANTVNLNVNENVGNSVKGQIQ